jgi:hypothetical protein
MAVIQRNSVNIHPIIIIPSSCLYRCGKICLFIIIICGGRIPPQIRVSLAVIKALFFTIKYQDIPHIFQG